MSVALLDSGLIEGTCLALEWPPGVNTPNDEPTRVCLIERNRGLTAARYTAFSVVHRLVKVPPEPGELSGLAAGRW